MNIGWYMFTLQLATSFIVGGLFIALQTLVAERVPLQWRGAILTIPSTSAISFLFIGLTKSAADIPVVARVFPAALAPCYVFVAIVAFLSIYSMAAAYIAGYGAWMLVAYGLVTNPPLHMASAVFVYSLPLIIVTYVVVKQLPGESKLIPVPFSFKHVIVRALIGGTVVCLAVFLSKKLGNVWGGLFSAFPAGFSATFLIYYFAHGKKIIRSVAQGLYFPGVIGYILYAWVASVAFPKWGIVYGTAVSYAAVALFYWAYNKVQSRS